MPIALRISAPAPDESIKGSPLMMKASGVPKIGRRRSFDDRAALHLQLAGKLHNWDPALSGQGDQYHRADPHKNVVVSVDDSDAE
jgi:hypothetical protein